LSGAPGKERLPPSRLYPWFIAVIGMLALFVSNGMTATGITIFDPPLLDEFHWPRGDFKFRDALNFWTGALIAPFVGILIDRVNPKYLLMTGCFLLSTGYVGYSMLSNAGPVPFILGIAALTALGLGGVLALALTTLFPRLGNRGAIALAAIAAAAGGLAYARYWMGNALDQVYVIHLLFSLALATSGSMVVIFLVSSWFVSHRGLAIGIALVGTSLGSALLPKLNPYLIEAQGWRNAFLWNALMPVVLFLLVWALVRGTARDAGTVAVGQSAAMGDLKQHGLTFREAVRTRSFWAIGVSGFCTYYAIFGFLQHAVLHMNKGFGVPLKQAGNVLLVFSLVAMAAKLINGALADRIDRHRVFLACLLIMLVGVIGLASMRRDLIMAAAVTIGIGWGGLFTLYNMLAVNNFGLREIGRINGSISLAESFGVGLGSWMTGRLFDAFGSYQVAFIVIAVMVFIAFLAGTQIRTEVDERLNAPRAASGAAVASLSEGVSG
jgi:cyanate permease